MTKKKNNWEELDKQSQEMTDRQWDVKRKSSGVSIKKVPTSLPFKSFISS